MSPQQNFTACRAGQQIELEARRGPFKPHDWGCLAENIIFQEDVLLHAIRYLVETLLSVQHDLIEARRAHDGRSQTSGQAGSRMQTPGLS